MDWIEIGRSFGIPVAVMSVMIWGVWCIIKWIGTELIIPLRNTLVSKGIVLFDKVEKTLDTLDKNISEIVVGMETYNKILINLESSSKNTAERITAEHNVCHTHHCTMADTLKDIVGGLRDIKSKTDQLDSSCPILAAPDPSQAICSSQIRAQHSTPAAPSGIITHPHPTPKRGPKS